jgi:signal transduction histidine kinase
MPAAGRESPPTESSAAGARPGTGPLSLASFQGLPIRWRILSIAVLNTIAVVVLALFVWRGANLLGGAWSDLRQARETDHWLIAMRSDVDRFQGLVHRYFTHPTLPVLVEIDARRAQLVRALDGSTKPPAAAIDVTELQVTLNRLLSGFDELQRTRAALVSTYERDLLKPAQDMAGLYSMVEGASQQTSLIWPALSRSREAFSKAVVAVTSFYLSQDVRAAAEARSSLALVESTAPVMIDYAETDLQRDALGALRSRATQALQGFDRLAAGFAGQAELLKLAVDANQTAMASVIDRFAARAEEAEEAAQRRFDQALRDVFLHVSLAGAAFLGVSVLLGVSAARSISGPLAQLRNTMTALAGGRLDEPIPGVAARDEVGDMARAVQVFQENALVKRQVEDELRAAKERAETALAVLRDAQASLVESEKLAALGALVAGVAHEVNNPVGISLTVASSLARRCDAIDAALADGPLRRSTFTSFLADNRDAANQLVTNLQRAAELVQAFKQVAVDRSHAERRAFDLAETTNQIVASLLPAARKQRIAVDLGIPPNLVVDSYPGAYGQVLTNLFLNSVTHAFHDREAGTIRIEASRTHDGGVQVTFSDDGAGMTDDVLRRAFEPFFTTRRGQGGTGLGLNITYNLVTHQLGGRISVESEPGRGTRFRMNMPLSAPRADIPEAEPRLTAEPAPAVA